VSQCILLNIYNSLILAYLRYRATVWANCNHSKLNSLHIIQKRVALKHNCKLNYYSHTAPYFWNLQVLAIFDIYNYTYPSLCYI